MGNRSTPSAAVQRAAQAEALRRWNNDAARPKWDSDGSLARHFYPGPLRVGLLHYLSEAGRAAVRAAAADQRLRRGKERRAVQLLQEMAKAAGEADELVKSVATIDSVIGVGVHTLRDVASSLPKIAAWRSAKLLRPELRGDLALDVRAWLTARGCQSPPSVLALASILCGEFPTLPDNEQHDAAMVIEEERKLIAAILAARKKSTKVGRT